MIQPGWRRFLPDRSQLMLLVIVVMGLAAGVSFVNLGITRNTVLAANRIAHERLAEAQEQNVLLGQALASAQQGENILPKAYEYYGETRPGVMTFEIKPVAPDAAADGAGAQRAGPPFWGDWWERLIHP
jgi:hypothetical protein